MTDLYEVAVKYATKPFQTLQGFLDLAYALVPVFNAEMKELVAAGATYLQIEDLGAWLPLFAGNEGDYKWIADLIGCQVAVVAKPEETVFWLPRGGHIEGR